MLIAVGQKMLRDGDPGRAHVIDITSATAGRGIETEASDNVLVFEHQAVFALKIYPDVVDSAGRKAPFVGCLKRSQVGEDGWLERALQEIRWFAEETQRSLDEGRIEEVRAALELLQKKKRTQAQRGRQLGMLVVALLLVAAILAWQFGV